VNKPKLDAIFQQQDEVLHEHLDRFSFLRDAYSLLSDAVYLAGMVITQMRFGDRDKQDAVASLAIQSLSPSIVAIRVGLWGDVPESLAVLRCAVESCARLQLVVRERKYKTAVLEMDNQKFEQLDFDCVSRDLGDFGQKIRKLRGLISNTAAHATAKRLIWNHYEHKDQTFFRAGFARNLQGAELTLFYCMDVCMWLTDALRRAHEQDNLEFRWIDDTKALTRRYQALKQQFSSRFSTTQRNE